MDGSKAISIEGDSHWWYHEWVNSFQLFANRFTGSDGRIYWAMDIEGEDCQKSFWISQNGIHDVFGQLWSDSSENSKIFDCGIANDVSDAERTAIYKAISGWEGKLATLN